MKFLIICILAASGWWWFYGQESFSERERPAGVLAPRNPVQRDITRSGWNYKDYRIQPMAAYAIRGRVLSTSRYWVDPQSGLAPYDIVLGWKRMSDSTNLNKIAIDQSSRMYFMYWKSDIGMTDAEVFAESANIHIIPGRDSVLEKIKSVKKGDIVTLAGYLVSVSGKNNFQWISSTNRSDRGQASSELMWVEEVTVE